MEMRFQPLKKTLHAFLGLVHHIEPLGDLLEKCEYFTYSIQNFFRSGKRNGFLSRELLFFITGISPEILCFLQRKDLLLLLVLVLPPP